MEAPTGEEKKSVLFSALFASGTSSEKLGTRWGVANALFKLMPACLAV